MIPVRKIMKLNASEINEILLSIYEANMVYNIIPIV